MTDMLYMLALRVPQTAAGAVADLLEGLDEPMALAVTQLEIDKGAAWRVEAIYDSPPDREAIRAILLPLAQELGLEDLDVVVDAVPERDWVVVSLELLAKIRAGRFIVYGEHDRAKVVPGRYSLEIEASRAFGTGQHETTRGCLLAINRLLPVIKPKRIFDLGCGTAILAMAAQRGWRAKVWAGDNDPQAIIIARETAAKNHLGHQIDLHVAQGFEQAAIRHAAPFDLVLANVLVNPLRDLAPVMRRRIAPGGIVILSGLLNRQAPNLANHYRSLGFTKLFQLKIGDWSTLALRRHSS